MIVTSEEASRAHMSTGVWGRVTLDHVLRKTAASAPDRLALADFADRAAWTSGEPLVLTYAELNDRVEALASFFAGLGINPDTVVATQMPPTTDGVVVLLGLIRAGLIVAPLPLALREAETIGLISALGAKAIVTVSETVGEQHGERMRDVAAELFQIRFVFAAGSPVPDGLIALDRVFAEAEALGAAPEIARKGNPADHAATIAWSAEPGPAGRPVQLLRSHNHWIATGLMTLLESGIEQQATIVSPLAPSGVAGIGCGIVPWLLSGGTLVTGLPQSVDRLVEEAARFSAGHILVPARFARRLAERLDAHRVNAALLVVNHDRRVPESLPRGHRAVDLTTLAERAVIARRRKDGAPPEPIRLGAVSAPADSELGPTLLELRLKAEPRKAGADAVQGDLQLRGAMVPSTAAPRGAEASARAAKDPAGWIDSGILAKCLDAHPDVAELNGRGPDLFGGGPMEIALAELDVALQACGGVIDAAAIPFSDGWGAGEIAAAVVPKPGTRFDDRAYLAELEATRMGLHRLPSRVITVPSIARAPSGRVLRTGMAIHLMRAR